MTLLAPMLAMAAVSGTPAQVSSAARQQLLPTGTLRVGLNYGNQLLAAQGGSQPSGIAVEVSRELARRLGVPVVFAGYPTPGALVDAVDKDEWDIAFIAADPDRRARLDFTAPYLELEATYLVRPGIDVRSVREMDRPGMSIASSATSAYTLYLQRALTRAQLRLMDADPSVAAMQRGEIDAIAGLRFQMLAQQPRVPGSRVLPDAFTRAQQAIATPKGKDEARAYLDSFLSEMKTSGAMAEAIGRMGLAGASVAQ